MKWTGFVGIFFGLVFFIWLIAIAVAPVHKAKEIQNLVNADSVFTEKFDSIFYHPDIVNLIKGKAYKEALLNLSKNDSIQLVINLSDSIINLSIKGVVIHQTNITEFKKDRLLRDLPLIHEIKLFSQPLPVLSYYSTIVKEPIVVRHAPKNPEEAALNAYQPDTLIQNPAFVACTIEHNFNIIFEQEENEGFYDNWKKFGFYLHLGFKKTIKSLENYFGLKKQEYQPVISIKIPVDDLRAIYRALPAKTFIVLKL